MGAAVLAYLFREFCKSCRAGVEEMAGCDLQLQLWALTRLLFLAHVPTGPVLESLDNPLWCDRADPYGMRWCKHLKFIDTKFTCAYYSSFVFGCSCTFSF